MSAIRKRIVSCVILLLCFCFVSACRRSDYPEGFPKIYPIQLVVVEDGSPIEGVQVVVNYTDQSLRKWRTSGFSGADGVVNLSTRGFDGAPEGESVLLVEKKDPPIKQTEDGQFVAGNTENQLDPRFSDPETSPFSVKITKKQKGKTVIDLGRETVTVE
ncbi:MAG: hypothetical protein ACOX6D_02965 [Thermoguttaceae bacterium]|jgi:uncharacterized membrane protein